MPNTEGLRFNLCSTGIELTSATVELNTPLEITERAANTTLTVDLIVNAGPEGGSAIGDDLWTAVLFFSTDENGIAMELMTEADIGDWRSTGKFDVQLHVTSTPVKRLRDSLNIASFSHFFCSNLQ